MMPPPAASAAAVTAANAGRRKSPRSIIAWSDLRSTTTKAARSNTPTASSTSTRARVQPSRPSVSPASRALAPAASSTTPATNVRRRPKSSATRPAVSRNAPRPMLIELRIQVRPEAPASRPAGLLTGALPGGRRGALDPADPARRVLRGPTLLRLPGPPRHLQGRAEHPARRPGRGPSAHPYVHRAPGVRAHRGRLGAVAGPVRAGPVGRPAYDAGAAASALPTRGLRRPGPGSDPTLRDDPVSVALREPHRLLEPLALR
jgi:hypothetical protein